MPRLRLTARTVEAARPPATGRLELFDEGLPGFCIRITANDRRTACVFYRIGSRLRRATLGTLPPLTLADARELAREALRQAALGHDPASARREAREELTFVAEIRRIAERGEVEETEEIEFGRKYTVPGQLRGPAGVAQVLTVWIQETGQQDVRLVTVRPRWP